jgi:hypothetical protein
VPVPNRTREAPDSHGVSSHVPSRRANLTAFRIHPSATEERVRVWGIYVTYQNLRKTPAFEAGDIRRVVEAGSMPASTTPDIHTLLVREWLLLYTLIMGCLISSPFQGTGWCSKHLGSDGPEVTPAETM